GGGQETPGDRAQGLRRGRRGGRDGEGRGPVEGRHGRGRGDEGEGRGAHLGPAQGEGAGRLRGGVHPADQGGPREGQGGAQDRHRADEDEAGHRVQGVRAEGGGPRQRGDREG